MSPKPEDLLTTEEAARLLRLSPRTLERYRSDGKIPYIKLSRREVRYHKYELEIFLLRRYIPQSDYCE